MVSTNVTIISLFCVILVRETPAKGDEKLQSD